MPKDTNPKIHAVELQAQAELLEKMLGNTETILELTRTLQRLLTLLDIPEDQAHLRDGLAGLLRQLVAGIEELHRQHHDRASGQEKIVARLEALEAGAIQANQDRAEILRLLSELHADTLEAAGS